MDDINKCLEAIIILESFEKKIDDIPEIGNIDLTPLDIEIVKARRKFQTLLNSIKNSKN